MVERPLWNHSVPEARTMIIETESRMDYVIRADADGHAYLVYVGEEYGDDTADDNLVLVDRYDE